MKMRCSIVVLLAAGAGAARLSDASRGHASAASGAVGEVVKMLQDMLKKSKDDWKSDKEAYDKFREYCDDNTNKKTKAIQDATKTIGLLSNKLAAIQGSNGDLSIKTAKLKAGMAENEKSRDEAKALRDKEEKSFQEEEKDLTAAIGQMNEAVKVLSAIGADQTLASSADHEKFMANYKEKSLLRIRTTVRQALDVASSFLEPVKRKQAQAFLQAPFTGTYSAQSGQVVGILKDMKATFESNLETAKATEKAAKEAYEKFKKNKEDEHAEMKKSYDDKQATLGTNDGDLASKKGQLQQASKQKDEDEDFLGKLTVQCADKKKEYEARKIFAASEDVALSKAIAILDNDVASEKFGAVDATSKGKTSMLLQLTVAKAHSFSPQDEVARILQKAAAEQHSARLGKVLMLLQAGNPFTVVLQQIDKLVKLAEAEQKVDDEEKAWCEDTNKKNDENLNGVKDDVKTIKGDITKLKASIDDPVSGIKKQMSEAEESLKTNIKNQGEETATRRKENVEYQKDVSTMQDAISILSKAKNVLIQYYDSLDNEQLGLIEEDPKPPTTFDGAYKGQNEQAKKVLGMLSFIQTETLKEEKEAHDAELKSQQDYEDSMKSLVEDQGTLQQTIVKLNKDLASKQKELEAKFEDETNVEKQKISIERYIAKMKPGCDFVIKKYDERKTARAAEKKALEGAKVKLEDSPAFKAAEQKAKEAGFGKCKVACLKDEASVDCKACLAGVSVPGYCAGHPGVKGC